LPLCKPTFSDATTWSITWSSIMPLESSIMILANIYSTVYTHNDHRKRVKICLQYRPLDRYIKLTIDHFWYRWLRPYLFIEQYLFLNENKHLNKSEIRKILHCRCLVPTVETETNWAKVLCLQNGIHCFILIIKIFIFIKVR
jgi:hypothetical protein